MNISLHQAYRNFYSFCANSGMADIESLKAFKCKHTSNYTWFEGLHSRLEHVSFGTYISTLDKVRTEL